MSEHSFREARRQITGDSWLAGVARASLSAAEAKFETPQAAVTCPPSAVHDMIVTWDEVCAGDLVLWDGELRTVRWNEPLIGKATGLRLVMLDGGDMPGTIPCGTYAAVRRYDTGEG